MVLTYPDGQPFAVGANWFTPFLPDQPEILRIVVDVEVEGLPLRAVVDTGAPYLICHPELAAELGARPDSAVDAARLVIRGRRHSGSLHRLAVTLPAAIGESVTVEATVFVPDLHLDEVWDLPNFIGLTGMLERMRFAVDPESDLFYFGPLVR